MTTSSRVAVIIVAAGNGTRLGANIPKAFVTLAGRTLLERAIDSVRAMQTLSEVIVVAPAERCADAEEQAQRSLGRAVHVTAGGASRQASVAAGLALVPDDIDTVLVHDAARALTPTHLFDRVTESAASQGVGIIPGLAVSDTIKRVRYDDLVDETIDRSALWAIQTPQGFPRKALIAAYASATTEQTDDAALVAAAGFPVRVIPGDARAFKITTPDDLARAGHLLDADAPLYTRLRTGFGTDTHAFTSDTELWLAGLRWPGETGLAGHSDGDVVIHAIVDALLSAAGMGDIGQVFGTDDPRFAGAHGDIFLTETHRRLREAGFRIVNVSAQFVGNRPRFQSRRREAEELLSRLLGAPISVSATTSDGLGPAGAGEGITACATALLYAGE